MSKKSVIYNGVKMTEDWPAKIEAAQSLTHYTIEAKKYSRIRFGDEGHRGWGQKPCLDCGVLKGQFHVPDCEYEKCPACGEDHAGGCRCDTEELREPGEEVEPIRPQGKLGRWILIGFGCLLIALLLLLVWTTFIVTE